MTVHTLVEQHLGAISQLCRRHRVRRLEVFGSGARGVDFDPERSDIDFLVEFDVTAGAPTLAEYFDLREELATILGRRVDLVTAEALVNPFVKAEVDRARQPVYAAA
jgi:predicted nucleotidyltransferase